MQTQVFSVRSCDDPRSPGEEGRHGRVAGASVPVEASHEGVHGVHERASGADERERGGDGRVPGVHGRASGADERVRGGDGRASGAHEHVRGVYGRVRGVHARVDDPWTPLADAAGRFAAQDPNCSATPGGPPKKIPGRSCFALKSPRHRLDAGFRTRAVVVRSPTEMQRCTRRRFEHAVSARATVPAAFPVRILMLPAPHPAPRTRRPAPPARRTTKPTPPR